MANLSRRALFVGRTSLAFVNLLGTELRHLFLGLSEKFGFRLRGKARYFNLDLHTAVISDVEAHMNKEKAVVTRFSISGANRLVDHKLPVPDPVAHVNSSNWRELGPKKIGQFQSRYEIFLSGFDGFVVTHTPSFTELYSKYQKPILCVISTRYEAPYTDQPRQWSRLNKSLADARSSGKLILVANNRADADYFSFFTGIKVPVIPSLCRKDVAWQGGSGQHLIMSKSFDLTRLVAKKTRFEPVSSIGQPFSWADLMKADEIFVIPQNVSTMTLFELATAGVPVSVPSKKMIRNWRADYEVMHELTYAEMLGCDVDSRTDSPANWKSPSYLDWWLDRADFYNSSLMPNIRVVESLSDLNRIPDKSKHLSSDFQDQIRERNSNIEANWSKLIKEFLDKD